MTNAELLAMLTSSVDRDAIDFDPDDEDGRYADWSTTTPDGLIRFEVGGGGEAVQVELSLAEIARLQQALTVFLLERQ